VKKALVGQLPSNVEGKNTVALDGSMGGEKKNQVRPKQSRREKHFRQEGRNIDKVQGKDRPGPLQTGGGGPRNGAG